ncbi:MAG: YegS/Rv2252/BmrU family lipid kinase [Oscillospiraceae bacterium]|nr:YegS/Rv2252/BmrU family lipid kinase [Oscillospiraceae bacterium]
MRACIILNPVGAGGRALKKWRKVKVILDAKGIEYKLYRSSGRDGIEKLCSKLTGEGNVTLIIIGGDGSMNQAVNGIRDFEHTKLGLIPAGTGNDFIRNFDIPKKLEDQIDYIFDGKVKHSTDVGEVTFHNVDDTGEDIIRRFNISCELGFGSEVCYRVDHSPLKKRFKNGSVTFLAEVLKAIKGLKPFTLTLTTDKQTTTYDSTLSCMVMNTCYEGGGMKFCPDALFDDGQFDIAAGNLSKAKFVSIIPLAYAGKTTGVKGIYMDRTPFAELVADTPQYAHADGECVGRSTHISVRMYGHRLKLLI